MKDIMKLDAGETAFFARQLEYIKSRTYDTKYKNLKAKMLLPVSSEAPAGADYIIWYSFSKAGQAKIIADYANDFPRVDVYATENQSKIKSLGDSYGYAIKEIRRAQMTGLDLNTRRANTARRAIEELIDNLAWNGDADFNIQGFLDYPGITEYTVPNGASTSPLWSTKTPDEIIKDLSGMKTAVSVPTNGREEIDTILLPRAQYNLIKDTRMTDGNTKTIFTFFMDNNPGITIEVLDELAGAGAGATDRMMGYVRDPNNVTLELPQPFEQLEADKKGMEYVIPCHAEHGGVIVYYPQSVVFGDGI
jgi:hypothetical protein